MQVVPAQPREEPRPHEPVDAAREDDARADDAVKVVRQVFVDVLVGGVWRDVRRDGEVDVAEQEEDGHGERRLDRRVPVVLVAVEVEVDEAPGYEDVHDGEWVGDDVEDCGYKSAVVGDFAEGTESGLTEVICVAGRRREHDDD